MIRAMFDHQNIRYYPHIRQSRYRTTDLPHWGRHQQNHLGEQSNHQLGRNNHPYRYPGSQAGQIEISNLILPLQVLSKYKHRLQSRFDCPHNHHYLYRDIVKVLMVTGFNILRSI